MYLIPDVFAFPAAEQIKYRPFLQFIYVFVSVVHFTVEKQLDGVWKYTSGANMSCMNIALHSIPAGIFWPN